MASFFEKLKTGLTKTRQKFTQTIRAVLTLGRGLDDSTVEQLTEALIAADVGPRAAERMAKDVQTAYRAGKFSSTDDALAFLKKDMADSLKK